MWLFFRLRFAFWVAMGLPGAFLGGLFLMSVVGLTINMISMVALLTEKSLQAQILIPLATSIVFGLFASTLLILFAVPTLFSIFADRRMTSAEKIRAEVNALLRAANYETLFARLEYFTRTRSAKKASAIPTPTTHPKSLNLGRAKLKRYNN